MDTELKHAKLKAKNPLKSDRWYVMDGGLQRGPLSWSDLQIEFETGFLSAQALVWSSPMVEWQKIDEIISGQTKIKSLKTGSRWVQTVVSDLSKKQNVYALKPEKKTLRARLKRARKRAGSLFWSKKSLFLKGSFLVLGASVAYHHFYLAPQLLIDSLSDELSHEDVSWVSRFFHEPPFLASSNSTLISISKNNGLTPTFYFFAPLKDQEEVEIRLEGQKDTLLERTHYEKTQRVKMMNHWAKSKVFDDWNHSRLGKGVYTVTALRASTAQVLSTRSFFLVSPKNEAYEQALSRYHLKQQEQSKLEMSELNQVMNTLESQAEMTNAVFHQRLMSKNSLKGKNDTNWDQLQNQLAEEAALWTEQRIAQEFYFYQEYAELKELIQDLMAIHARQQQYQLGSSTENEKNLILEQETLFHSKLLSLRTRLFKNESI